MTNKVKNPLIKRVQDELIKRLTDADWHEITINMKKSGDNVSISPCGQTSNINKLEDVEYFLVTSPTLPWLGGDTIETISEQIVNYDKYIAEHIDDRKQLHDFYENHLSGHTDKELRDGNTYFDKIFNIWQQNRDDNNISLDELINNYDLSSIAENNDTADYVRTAIKVSMDYSAYSDWHKDVYGRRPQIKGNF